MAPEPATEQDVRGLARRHGLDLEQGTVRFEEAGLDYRVAFAAASGTGEQWVLRIPRRPDVAAKVADELRILDFVRPRLPVAVPDWRIAGPELVAYPLLPGRPGLTLDAAGQPVWHYDTASPEHARSLAEVVASLHRLDPAAAAAAGVSAETPEQALYELYLGSGVGRDGDVGLQSLIDFMMATTAARHDIHDWPYQHPDSLLPGSPVAPDCD